MCIFNMLPFSSLENFVSFFPDNREVMIQELTKLQNRMGHVQSLTSAVSDRFSQLVANHRRFLMLTQMCGGNQESTTQPLRERLEDLVNNKVDAEKSEPSTQQQAIDRLEELVNVTAESDKVVSVNILYSLDICALTQDAH
ncbi:uncharacterized protein LOC135221121 [Macrobrachium nipponense]|uniref:uncharacterized protein LOC135221121 n=1 Tax=Macrobrachium nipponense TaxID=159736 RepID=UPI0030C7B24B